MLKWIHRGSVGLLVSMSLAALIANWIPGVHTLVSAKHDVNCSWSIQLTGGWIALVDSYFGVVPRSKSNPLTHDYGVVAFGGIDDSFVDIQPSIYRETAFIIFPAWVIAALTMIYPGCFLLWHRRRVTPSGGCKGCDYNLIGNESGICPECGEAVEVTA